MINLIYMFFLITSLLFFFNQFLTNSMPMEVFIKVIFFYVFSSVVLLFSYKKSKRCFNAMIEFIGVNQKIAVPTLMFVFIGGFSIAMAIIFIAFLQALGILFIVESLESLFLNILALVSFFWLAFVLFMGWDFIKITCFVSQYKMVMQKKSSFLENMGIFFGKLHALRNAFLGFVAIDLACGRFPKISRRYYKILLLPVKIWSACLTLYEGKSIANSLGNSFSFFKRNSFKPFSTASLSNLFLPTILVPVIFSLGIILSNLGYFLDTFFFGSYFFIIIYFLIFMSLGFFFSYSIIISLESAYYVKILSLVKDGKTPENIRQQDYRINFVEEESLDKISKLKGDVWDTIRIYF